MFLAAIDPVAISLGVVQIYWYGVIMGTAALLGLWLAVREANRRGLNGELLIDMMIWVIPSAIIGARLYYVLFQWDYYLLNPADIIAVWEGGLAIHGGLIGGMIAGAIFLRVKKENFLLLADIVVPSIILGQAIGRWGNFINQEAHGAEVTLSYLQSLHLPQWMIEQMHIQGAYYHPTFLYESLWNLAGFILLISLRRLPLKQGELFFSYLVWYSLGRFFIEGLRTDSLAFNGPAWLESALNALWTPMTILSQPGMLDGGNVRIAQLMSLLLVLAGIGLIVWRRLKKDAATYPPIVAKPETEDAKVES
jgi:phosphatidylglycerol---prolipoprotein diacylglyceryl transferase